MKVKKPSQMTNDELLKKEKIAKMTLYALLTMTILLTIAIIFLFIRKGFSALVVMPFSMVTFIIINSNTLKEIKREIALRDL